MPALSSLDSEIHRSLTSLNIRSESLSQHKIAVSVGSRGIASLREITRAVCDWLKERGALPFAFPAMGSHGGATAEGQLEVLKSYGVTEEYIGAEIRATMETVSLGLTPGGFEVFMDRNACEADGILVMNRIKPHTDFSGTIESGLLKMMTIGLGKEAGAREAHHWFWKYGYEKVIRAMSGRVLASGKILCALGLIENEYHQIAQVRAIAPGEIAVQEEAMLKVARGLVARIPFSKLDLLVVDEIGKNISGAGMDTKIIGRGLKEPPPEAPQIGVIYARDLTTESEGNAVGVGLADLIHGQLYRKINYETTFINVRTSLNLPMARIPMYFASDKEALDFALGSLGSPEPERQRTAWIRNTLNLGRIGVSAALAREGASFSGWRLTPETFMPETDSLGNFHSPF